MPLGPSQRRRHGLIIAIFVIISPAIFRALMICLLRYLLTQEIRRHNQPSVAPFF